MDVVLISFPSLLESAISTLSLAMGREETLLFVAVLHNSVSPWLVLLLVQTIVGV
jgi:hypothetical protein